jgi:Biotin-requiring enzyme
MLKQAARGASQAASCSGIWAPLSQNLAAGCAGLVQRLHTSANALATDVVVPSMGDSITEGSISSVLKAANDAVDEDEPILQIETDKVRLTCTPTPTIRYRWQLTLLTRCHTQCAVIQLRCACMRIPRGHAQMAAAADCWRLLVSRQRSPPA